MDVDKLVGTEHRRHLEALRHTVDDDDSTRATLAGNGNGVQPEAPSALNDNALANLHVGQIPAAGHLRHGAIDARDELV